MPAVADDDRLAGEGTLVDAKITIKQSYVRRQQVPSPDSYKVTWNELP